MGIPEILSPENSGFFRAVWSGRLRWKPPSWTRASKILDYITDQCALSDEIRSNWRFAAVCQFFDIYQKIRADFPRDNRCSEFTAE
eukprot:1368522-Amorphochlora_amoeboformis.AAC.1